MKFLRYIPLLFLAAACQQEISPEQADKFLKVYGNAYMDVAKDIAVLDDGRFAFCGIDSIPGEGSRAVLVLTDKFGNVADGFPKYYSDGTNNSGANAMVVKEGGDGGFLIVGYVDVPIGDTDSTQSDIFLIRTSNTGREIWRRSFGAEGNESVLHASTMYSTGGFILCGYQEKEGVQEIMIMGVEDQGAPIKLDLFPETSSYPGSANYICNTGSSYLCVCTYKRFNNTESDILLIGFDETFSPVVSIIQENINQEGLAMEMAGDNQYIVLGNRVSLSGRVQVEINMVEISGFQITSTYSIDVLSDASADLIANRITKLEDGRFAIVGTREADGNKDIFVQFLESDYSVGERILYGGSGVEMGADVDVPIDGGMIILGTSGEDPSSMISLIRTGEDGAL